MKSWLFCFVLIGAFWGNMTGSNAFAESLFSQNEVKTILSHGPWPLPIRKDKTNRFSGDPKSEKLGESLFFDVGLSGPGTISCATCHDPAQSFTDGLKTASTIKIGHRNTPSVLNTRFQHWYGWAGSVDTLWGASLRAILNPDEMGGSAELVAGHIQNTPILLGRLKNLIGSDWIAYSPEQQLILIGKLLAAYTETLITPPSEFDLYRDALAAQDLSGMSHYPLEAKRGLKLFVGRGQCSLCHFGPLFSNLEFADSGVPYFIRPGVIDKGRYQGIKDLKKSPYSSLGNYSDDASKTSSLMARHVSLLHRNWGEFKVPSLRSVSKTAPYMHNGSLRSLDEVIQHYSELNEDRLHVNGVAILRSLNLSVREKKDLLAFLKSL